MRPDPRLFFLDWLRILAFGVLVVYHVGMVYVTWDFHVKSPAASRALEPWMLMSGPWRMSLLFMVSGAATAFMLRRGERIGTLLRQRTARLLLPLLCGVVLLVPPQPYVEVVQKLGYAGSYWDFLGLYFSGDRGFCPTANA
jgi:glucan biosynthesis protein C